MEVEEVAGAPDGLGWRSRVRFAVDELVVSAFTSTDPMSWCRWTLCLIASAAVEALGVEGLRLA